MARTLPLLALLTSLSGCGYDALAGAASSSLFPPQPDAIRVGEMSASFQTAEEFYELPRVADLLARAGIEPAVGSDPPSLVGEYDADGTVVRDDFRPQDEGRSVQRLLKFFDPNGRHIGFSLDGSLGVFARGAPSTTHAVVTGSRDAFTVHFHVVMFEEREIDGWDIGCFESRLGVIHGTRLPDGTLEIRIATVSIGVDGRCVGMMRDGGVRTDELVGSLRMFDVLAFPR